MTKTAGVAIHQTYCAVVIGDAMLPCLIIRLKGLSMPYKNVIHRSNHSLMLHGLHCGPGTLLAFPCFGLSAREPSITGIGPPGLNGSKPHRHTNDAEKTNSGTLYREQAKACEVQAPVPDAPEKSSSTVSVSIFAGKYWRAMSASPHSASNGAPAGVKELFLTARGYLQVLRSMLEAFSRNILTYFP